MVGPSSFPSVSSEKDYSAAATSQPAKRCTSAASQHGLLYTSTVSDVPTRDEVPPQLRRDGTHQDLHHFREVSGRHRRAQAVLVTRRPPCLQTRGHSLVSIGVCFLSTTASFKGSLTGLSKASQIQIQPTGSWSLIKSKGRHKMLSRPTLLSV